MILSIKKYKEIIKEIKDQNNEIIWSHVWDDTRKGIEWAKDLPSISPGRWAVGYNYLYVMTRVLNELEPQSVLDIGLGISSTLISSYFEYMNFQNGIHTIIDQDQKWIDFYTKHHILSRHCEIIQLDCIKKEHNGYEYFAYNDFEKSIDGKTYDVISIDAPKGSDRYSRRDIVDCIPYLLNEDFVIILDDVNRIGERDTIAEIEEKLKANGIEYETGYYAGQTECALITTKKNSFLCSL